MASYQVGSRVAVIDRASFSAFQGVRAPAVVRPSAYSAAGSGPEIANDPSRALMACALWLHVGFIGALCAAAGLVVLVDSDIAVLRALGVAILGGVTAIVGWRRGRSVLERSDRTLRVRRELEGR